jgi:hypothetical protein
MNTEFKSLKLMEGAHFGIDIDDMIILTWILHKQRVRLYTKFL